MPKRKTLSSLPEIRSVVSHKRVFEKTQLETLRKTLSTCEQKLSKLKGPRNIVKAKDLLIQIKNLRCQIYEQRKILRTKTLKPPPKSTENQKPVKSTARKMSTTNRLLPAKKNQHNIFLQMSNTAAQRWQNRRSHSQRHAATFEQKGRVQTVDMCPKCYVSKCVDKEMAISVCPKCGNTNRFATHIFDTKEVEKDSAKITRQQSLSHMQKFSAQFERGYPCMPVSVLETMSVAYRKIHVRDPAKVQLSATNRLLKTLRQIPRTYKRAPDRMTKELKCEAVPEYTSQELSQLLNQRNRLHAQEDDQDEKKHKKSFTNPIYMRQFGRANMMEQSRLFPHAKTTRIHMERTRAMERECTLQRNKLGDKPSGIWSLYPST